MKQKVFIAILSFLSAFFAGPVSAQQKVVDNVLFEIVRLDHPVVADDAQGYIAISYQLTNNDPKRKLFLDGELTYKLLDEFGNQYRKIDPPNPSIVKGKTVPKGFPSIYPGQTYGEEIFFEPPIATANELSLIISVTTLKITSPVKLTMILDPDIPKSVKIESPMAGTVLAQGQVAHLNIKLTGKKPPKRLVVMALGNVFEDNAPSFDNVYDVNVPITQAPGAYAINVLAQWEAGAEDIAALSDEIQVDVKEAVPIDIF